MKILIADKFAQLQLARLKALGGEVIYDPTVKAEQLPGLTGPCIVMDQIRRAGINIEEVQNTIFDGAAAASCRIQLDAEPGADLLRTLVEAGANGLKV